MQITLRRAAKLRNRIEEVLNSLETELGHITKSVNIFDSDAITQITNASTNYSNVIGRFTALSQVLYQIRARVGSENASTGIDVLLTNKAVLERQRKILLTLTRESPTARAPLRYGVEELTPMPSIDQMRSRIANEIDRAKTLEHAQITMSFSIVSQDMINTAKQTMSNLINQLDSIQNQIENINFQESIEISDSEAALLQSENIVI